MHLLDQRLLGGIILFLLGLLVIVKQVSTGSVLDKPKGNLLVQLVNGFNLLFLLVVIPLTAILLIARRFPTIDPAPVRIDSPSLRAALEITGLVVCVMGFLLMIAALVALGRNYQLGGSAPRSEDALVVAGPFRLIRHPMYTAALGISLGLACLIQSWILLGVFAIYVVLILLLVPIEEDGLRQAYGEPYDAYRQATRKLIPFVY